MVSERRRRLLELIAATGTIGLAGCSGDDGGDGTDSGDGTESGDGGDGGSSDGGDGGSGDGGDGSDGDDGDDGDGEDSDPFADAGTDSWPQKNYDAAQTSNMTDASGPSGSLEKKWGYTLGSEPGLLPPVLGDGVVVQLNGVSSSDDSEGGELVALNEATGEVLWETTLEGPGFDVALTDGTVHAVDGGTSGVVAYDARSGEQQWTAEGRNIVLVDDGTVYTNTPTSDNSVLALDAADGSEKWRTEVGGQTTVDDGLVYRSTADGRITALDAGNGEQQWEAQIESDSFSVIIQPPSVADGTLVVPTGSGTVHTFDTQSGSEGWSTEVADMSGQTTSFLGTPTIGDGTVFVGGDDSIWALSLSDGSEQWESDLGTNVSIGQRHAYDGDSLYYSDHSSIAVVDPSDGTMKQELSPEETNNGFNQPVYANGAVYTGTLETILTKYGPE